MTTEIDRPLPSPELQYRTVGLAGADAMREARDFAQDCVARFVRSPRWAEPRKTLLDFGACWGRITRCFLPHFAPEQIIGVDNDAAFLAYFEEAFPESRAIVCRDTPPIGELPGASCDFIVGYSVFSHLSERLCRAWTEEFARLLRPGGMLALTTRPRWFFDFAAGLSGPESDQQFYSHMFADFADAKARYDRGEFVHAEADYGETFIPESYARSAYADVLTFVEFADARRDQPIMFFRR
jgi:SAM-dependent methyltransferase